VCMCVYVNRIYRAVIQELPAFVNYEFLPKFGFNTWVDC